MLKNLTDKIYRMGTVKNVECMAFVYNNDDSGNKYYCSHFWEFTITVTAIINSITYLCSKSLKYSAFEF